MSKQISIPGFIHAKPADRWEEGPHIVDGLKFDFWRFDDLKSSGYVQVVAHTLTFEIPDGWDPRPGQIEALEARRAALQAEFSKAVMLINAQIQSLQAIEHTEPA